MNSETKNPIFNDKTYDLTKYSVTVFLPASATLYFTLGQLWSWPNVELVVGSITGLTTFLGLLIGYSSSTYKGLHEADAGVIDVHTKSDNTKTYTLVLNGDPDNLDKKKSVTFKINPL